MSWRYLLIATPGFTIVRRDGKWGMLNDRGRPIVPCVYDAVYYKEGHTVIDTQADTSEAGKSVAAPNGGFREKLLYMQKEVRLVSKADTEKANPRRDWLFLFIGRGVY